MDTSFCLAALDDALARFGRPEIFNTDQGSQFTSMAFTGALAAAGIKISMDGRGRWMDDVVIEHVSLKHEYIYLKGYADGREAKAGVAAWMAFYNDQRHHQALGYRAPMEGIAKAVDMMDNAARCPQAHSKSRQQRLWRRDKRIRSGLISNEETVSSGPAPRVHFSRRVAFKIERARFHSTR